MTPQLWIAVGFSAALTVFLMITYFVRDTSSAAQNRTLRFLTALCAGFAGGPFTGEALFRIERSISGGLNFFISGTAGCALFFAIWFTYGKQQGRFTREQQGRIRVTASIPEGWTFEQAARSIVRAYRALVVFEGLQSSQLATKLPETDIDAPSISEALSQLQYSSSELPGYRVEVKNGVFHVRT